MGGKGMDQQNPKPTGLDELDVPTNETDVPVTYFAGIAKLNVSWLMVPLITRIVAQDNSGGK
jgi:hypothetical protein